MEIQHKYSISRCTVGPLPPNIICARVISEQRWRKMKGGSGIGEHTQVWSMMVIVGGGGNTTLYMHCTLYWGGSVTTNVHTSLTMTLKTNMGLYWFDRYCQYYTHETWRMLVLRYSAMSSTLLPCRGHIVFHDTSFVSILISDTDLIIRRAQMESVIGSNINSGLDWSVDSANMEITSQHLSLYILGSLSVKRMVISMEKPRDHCIWFHCAMFLFTLNMCRAGLVTDLAPAPPWAPDKRISQRNLMIGASWCGHAGTIGGLVPWDLLHIVLCHQLFQSNLPSSWTSFPKASKYLHIDVWYPVT